MPEKTQLNHSPSSFETRSNIRECFRVPRRHEINALQGSVQDDVRTRWTTHRTITTWTSTVGMIADQGRRSILSLASPTRSRRVSATIMESTRASPPRAFPGEPMTRVLEKARTNPHPGSRSSPTEHEMTSLHSSPEVHRDEAPPESGNEPRPTRPESRECLGYTNSRRVVKS